MFKIWYAVENAWGVDTDYLETVYTTVQDAIADGKETFEPYEEWWIEDMNGNVIDGDY